jgi:putative DNA methylase
VTKLIEVALPIEAISAASRREKDKKTGTIRNVHKWFAPMPGPAWRALLFAALIDDPGDERRPELLDLIARLVPADGGPPPEDALLQAQALIADASHGELPTVLDPFCGGGSTLIEAQRLGLRTIASDLNPVPALITRVLTDLIPSVAGREPLGGDPAQLGKIAGGGELSGFLADVNRYGERVRERVWEQIGRLYPAPPEGGTIAAWLWARTVGCPNPACRATAPLASSFWLSKRRDALTWVEPVVLPDRSGVEFHVRTGGGGPPSPTKIGRGGTFRCAVCGATIPEAHTKAEGMARRLGTQLMAVAVDAATGRTYLPPKAGLRPPDVERPEDIPDIELAEDTRALWCKLYGAATIADQFTSRQLNALGSFADAVAAVADEVRSDGGDDDYVRAIVSVLGLCVGKLAQSNSTQVRWNVRSTGSSKAEPAYSRHALPFVWDFVEVNPFASSVGSWLGQIDSVSRGLLSLPRAATRGTAVRCDAREASSLASVRCLIATDPPYFAQIGYADLSDYFYIWHRRALREIHPDLFSTIATPKDSELIAAPHRHAGDRREAARFFVEGFRETFRGLVAASRPDLPIVVVYAHRQEESDDGGLTATAWDAMLSAILEADLRITGTWPVHGTREARQIGLGTNALASYIILVCRPQMTGAKVGDLQSFLSALRAELPRAITKVKQAAISAIDLGQATIGPGMAIFSRFAYVVDPSTGKRMTVHRALELINQVRAEVIDDFAGALSPETRWAMIWFRDYGFDEANSGQAEKLFTTTNTSLDHLKVSGIADSRRGKVRLLSRDELADSWDPESDGRSSEWATLLHLVKRYEHGGEEAAGALLRRVPDDAQAVNDLAYWLVDKCQFTQGSEVLAFDDLITSWPRITEIAAREEQGEATTLPV